MLLSRYMTIDGIRWACDGKLLKRSFSLASLLGMADPDVDGTIRAHLTDVPPIGSLISPIEAPQEVWASGVTYLRSREARKEESEVADVYQKVYDADRPELFFKANGWRVVGPEGTLRIRPDSAWNVPEPELTLVINSGGRIIGYCAGNDMSSRSIEGENPLYLPQAKVYNGSCGLGPAIVLADTATLKQLAIRIRIERSGATVFEGDTLVSKMRRSFEELAAYLFRELEFPSGVFLMTGTGIVPPERFTLLPGDRVVVDVGSLCLSNPIG